MKNGKIERISVENISKSFDLNLKKNEGALFRITSFLKGAKENKLHVLKSVSLKAYAGEVVGLIGLNGSGKSTLLRIIAGVYTKDSGSVTTNGKMIYLSGFGQALSPKLTTLENIYLIGSVMGLSRKDVRSKIDEIIDFAGLKDFLDMKVYKFSSGMVTRLNFSIGIHCLKHHNPDILLLDEVFGAGGDINFQIKAIEKMADFISGGATVILVSHSLKIIKGYCNRAILLDHGKVITSGNPEKVIEDYIHFSKGKT